MVFLLREGIKQDIIEELVEVLGKKFLELYKLRDYMVIFEKEEDIINLNLDMEKLKKLNIFGIIVILKGNDIDFVLRYFILDFVICEDLVIGLLYCILILYWKKVLNKNKFVVC